MVKLSTHIRIIRMATEGKFENGKGKAELFFDKTFPNEIIYRVDATFTELKVRLNELNKKKIKYNSFFEILIVPFFRNNMSHTPSGIFHISFVSGNKMYMHMGNCLTRCCIYINTNIVAIWLKYFV